MNRTQEKGRTMEEVEEEYHAILGCVLVYRYTREGNINELRHNSMYGYENKRNSLVYRYTRTAPHSRFCKFDVESIINPHPVGLLAQLVERCTGIAEVMGSNSVRA